MEIETKRLVCTLEHLEMDTKRLVCTPELLEIDTKRLMPTESLLPLPIAELESPGHKQKPQKQRRRQRLHQAKKV